MFLFRRICQFKTEVEQFKTEVEIAEFISRKLISEHRCFQKSGTGYAIQ